jgi:putative DNA primase/helicase
MIASPQELTAALDGCWHGSYGMAKCPAHADRNPSLSITAGQQRLLLHCFAGCSFREVVAAIEARLTEGLRSQDYGSTASTRSFQPPCSGSNIAAARALWQSALADGVSISIYLQSRGIGLPPPSALRFSNALYHRPSKRCLPAVVAAVRDKNGRITGLQRTFLRLDLTAKAEIDPPRMALGKVRGSSVHLGEPVDCLGISEGIETGLAAMELYGIPVWASLGPHGDQVEIPGEVGRVIVFGDNGKPGERIAQRTAEAACKSRRKIEIAFPPPQFGDFNDALIARKEARRRCPT